MYWILDEDATGVFRYQGGFTLCPKLFLCLSTTILSPSRAIQDPRIRSPNPRSRACTSLLLSCLFKPKRFSKRWLKRCLKSKTFPPTLLCVVGCVVVSRLLSHYLDLS